MLWVHVRGRLSIYGDNHAHVFRRNFLQIFWPLTALGAMEVTSHAWAPEPGLSWAEAGAHCLLSCVMAWLSVAQYLGLLRSQGSLVSPSVTLQGQLGSLFGTWQPPLLGGLSPPGLMPELVSLGLEVDVNLGCVPGLCFLPLLWI